MDRTGEDCLQELNHVVRNNKERVVRYFAGIGVGVRFGVHTSNFKNLARGIVERVFYVVRDGGLARPPCPKLGVYKRLQAIRSRLCKTLHSTPVVAREDYPFLYSGRKQSLYLRAVESLVVRAISLKDSYVNTFVKAEKVNLSSKVDPAPRVIQPRSPRYNVEVGRYLKLFEVELCQGFKRAFGYKVILKGLNADQVAGELRQSWELFRNPVAVGLDASRFDQHVSVEALGYEHSIYNTIFRSAELQRLLKWQLKNTGYARCDDGAAKYQVTGCRMSGDINTGMGNCLIMSSIVLAYLEAHGLGNGRARLANNGDDCVVICDSSDLEELSGLDQWFLDFGFTLTRELPVEVFEKIEFCQFQPVLCSTGWRMVRNPHVAMSKDATSLLSWDTEEDVKAWACAISSCGLSLTTGVPVWQAWYERLSRVGSYRESATDSVYDSGLGYASRGVQLGVITPESRVSFWRAFGILPDHQEDFEAEFSEPLEITGPVALTYSQVRAIDVHENPICDYGTL